MEYFFRNLWHNFSSQLWLNRIWCYNIELLNHDCPSFSKVRHEIDCSFDPFLTREKWTFICFLTNSTKKHLWECFPFWSSILPLASTVLVQSTIKLCTVHCLSSTLSISQHQSRESTPEPLGVKPERYLCAMQPPRMLFFVLCPHIQFVSLVN